MKAQFLVHILKILKKWLSQSARIPTNLFVSLLSLLRRFAAHSLKRGDRSARFSTSAHQGDVAREDVLICSSLPGSRFLEVAGDSSSLSDSPYSDNRAPPDPRSDAMEVHSSEADPTSAAESYGPYLDSDFVSLPRQTGESSLQGELGGRQATLHQAPESESRHAENQTHTKHVHPGSVHHQFSALSVVIIS